MAILEAYPAPSNPLTTLTQWEILFSRYQWSGIDGTPGGTQLQPTLDTANRAIKVASGGAMIRGVRWGCDSVQSTAIPAASGQDRVDRLVLRLDRTKSTAAEYVVLKVITGTAGSSTPPSITQTEDGIWDEYICRWTSAASGALSGLVDERSWMATDGMVPCWSYRRPSSGFGTLMGELDTEVFRVGLGGGRYLTVAEDSGDIALSSAQANWQERSPNCIGRRLNGVAYIDINLSRENTTVSAPLSDDGSNLIQLPANLRPVGRDRNFAVTLTGNRHGRLDVQAADGLIVLRHIDEDIAAGRYLRQSISYPVT